MKRNHLLLSAPVLLALVFLDPSGGRQGGADLQIRTLSGDRMEISEPRLVSEAGKPPRLAGMHRGKAWIQDLEDLWELSYVTGVVPSYEQDKAKAFFQIRGSSSLPGKLVGGDPSDPKWFRFKMKGTKDGLVLRQHLLALRLQPVRKPKADPVVVIKPRGAKAKAVEDSGPKSAAGPKKALDGGFAKALASPPENRDLIFVEDKKKRVRSFACDVRGVDDKGVRIEFRGQTRSLPLSRIYGIVFGTLSGVAPDLGKQEGLTVELRLRDERRFRGKLVGLAHGRWTLALADKIQVRFSSLWVQDAGLLSDRFVYLSDLDVKDRIQKPMLGREWPILRNHSGGGRALQLAGESFRKGFVLVPDVSFRVDFPRPYGRLLGQVGMPRSIVGSATLRFLVDGEQVGSDFELEADGKLHDIDIDLKGAKELSIELEHSADLDAGARVILGDLRAINTQ